MFAPVFSSAFPLRLVRHYNSDFGVRGGVLGHQWRHTYERTLLAWLRNLDDRKPEVLRVLARHYGPDRAKTWFVRWRLFLLGCAELFGYNRGCEWMVAHHLLEKGSA